MTKSKFAILFFLLVPLSYGFMKSVDNSYQSFREHTVRSKVVKLLGDKGSCSGVQVKAPSGVNYILTAAHCKDIHKVGVVVARDQSGKILERKILAESPTDDLMLVEGVPGLSGLDVADMAHKEVRTFTMGGSDSVYKTEGELLEEGRQTLLVGARQCLPRMAKYKPVEIFLFPMCEVSVNLMASTASVRKGSSGGPVVDKGNKLVGIVSAWNSESRISYFVPLKAIQAFMRNY